MSKIFGQNFRSGGGSTLRGVKTVRVGGQAQRLDRFGYVENAAPLIEGTCQAGARGLQACGKEREVGFSSLEE